MIKFKLTYCPSQAPHSVEHCIFDRRLHAALEAHRLIVYGLLYNTRLQKQPGNRDFSHSFNGAVYRHIASYSAVLVQRCKLSNRTPPALVYLAGAQS